MLTEGKVRVSEYAVTWCYEGSHGHTYGTQHWQASTAQKAADGVRKYSAPEGAKIVEVAKVVNNWK